MNAENAKTMYMGLTNIPMMNAEIVMGVSLMLLFIAFRFTLGFKTILLAHITFNIPYVILSVIAKIETDEPLILMKLHWTLGLLRPMHSSK